MWVLSLVLYKIPLEQRVLLLNHWNCSGPGREHLHIVWGKCLILQLDIAGALMETRLSPDYQQAYPGLIGTVSSSG